MFGFVAVDEEEEGEEEKRVEAEWNNGTTVCAKWKMFPWKG